MFTAGSLHATRAKLFSTDRTLTGSSVPGARHRGAGVVRKMLAIFISPITPLLGTRISSLLALGVTTAPNHLWQLHRQIFFTDCILTGGAAPCPLPGILHAGAGERSPHEAHQPFLTNWTLTRSPPSVLRLAIERHRRNPARGPITTFLASIGNRRLLGVMCPGASAPSFFSPITL